MSQLFHRKSSVSCFFCRSPVVPHNSRSFRCTSCHCWNRYDERGEIISEEPAMHIASLNLDSFAKRASPSRDQFPSAHSANLFCHTCQSNQLLLVNLLSNYLPSPNDPEYSARLAMLPEYKDSLHTRYPPICESCLPAVEEEIQRKDHMARTRALGVWLNDSKRKEQQRRVLEVNKECGRLSAQALGWRIRGVLWATTNVAAIAFNLAGALGVQSIGRLSAIRPFLPVVVFLSLFWTFWDPTYLSFQRATRQGSQVSVRGKRMYIQMQVAAWLLRLLTSSTIVFVWYKPAWTRHVLSFRHSRIYFTSSFLLECTIFAASCIILRIHRPPAVRLLNSNAHKLMSPSSTPQPSTRSDTPAIGLARPSAVSEPDLFAALSLSSKPVISKGPVFGLPSLSSTGSSGTPSTTARESDNDAMDWAPTDGSQNKSKAPESDEGSWLRPQRFFAPEKPSGLEGLFERTLFVDDRVTDGRDQNLVLEGWKHLQHRWTKLLFVVPIVIAIGGAVYKLCDVWWNVPGPENGSYAPSI